MSDEAGTTEEGGADEWADALNEQSDAEAGAAAETEAEPEADWGAALDEQEMAEAEQAPMQNLVADGGDGNMGDTNLDVILDIPISISLQIGSTKISIRNLLKLNQGSVVELDRLAGKPLEELVNGTLIAHGEGMGGNEKYGIRLTDVISAAERIQKLK